MSTPVTRGELREELGQLEGRFDQKLERLEARVDDKLEQLEVRLDGKLEQLEARVDRKFDLWGGALLARIEAGERRILAELARHASAIQEAVSIQISVIDEKYADLPERVSRLEAAVARRRPRGRLR